MKNSIFIAAAAVLLCSAPLSVQAAKNETLSQVFKRVGGSVVVVHTSGREVTPTSKGQPASTQGIGSGVLISADGKIMTAAHVVQTAEQVIVELPGEVHVGATIVASDAAADVALLQLDRVPAGVQPAVVGDSNKAEVGDEVFVVGAPFGISHTLTVGHLSARRRANITFGGMALAELFQTDAAINQGNSGGPMFNLQGEVIGIVSHIVSQSGGFDGLGFVVTSNMARHLLLEEPSVWNGLEGYLLTGDLAHALNLPGARMGLLVQRVATGSPAARLGLNGGNVLASIGEESLVLGGDVILAVEGIQLAAPNAYETIRRRLIEIRDTSGAAIRIAVLRDGEQVELSAAVPRTALRGYRSQATGHR